MDNYITLYDKDGNPSIGIILTEEGKIAYVSGESLDFYKGHFDCMLDLKRIALADFK